jgi:diguanylate cyclase (GGDEF)-like protein/PAS domain S-box-containing protein
MIEYRLPYLLDMTMVQKLADANFRAGGLPMTLTDAFTLKSLVKSGWPRICKKFHRTNPRASARCLESGQYVKDHVGEAESLQYKCKNGLWHIGMPIVVAGRHLATLYLSQFWFAGEVPDREYFTRQAREFGIDPDEYLAELHRMPVFSREKVDYIIAYDKALVQFIADLAAQSLRVIETKQSLCDSEDKYRTLVDNLRIGVYRNTPGQGRFLKANPAMPRIFGYDSVEEFMAVEATDLYQDPEDRKPFLEEIKRNGFVKDREMVMKKKDGTPIWVSTTATAHHDECGEILWMDSVTEDVTERKKTEEALQKVHAELEMRVRERTADLAESNELLLAEIAERTRIEEKLRELSEKDPLTAIYNRRKLFELLGLEVEQAKRYGRPLSLIMLDLDHFKEVNDRYGHNAGDLALKKTTNIVENVIRKVDIFARYGGEEFVILLPETNLGGAAALAEKIRTAVERHSYPAVGKITLSAGVAELSGKNSGAALIKKADEALYAAKHRGRNRVEAAPADRRTVDAQGDAP